MYDYKSSIKTVWYKAAALGSIWASFEIVIGSFLHNVRFPMSGTILTILAVIIIITFTQLWQQKGIVIRAGLIAALMKSISPSAVLLGPMTGIFFEALLIEFAFFIFGRNWIGYIFAGIFALYSVLIHKIITLLILYGTDIVKITENLYFFVSKQLNIKNLEFYEAILILSTFYVLAGLFASVLGIYIGRKSIKESVKEDVDFKVFKKDFIQEGNESKHSVLFLFFHLIIIIGLFVSINFLNLYIAVALGIGYIIFCFVKYKNGFKHFKKFSFWIQIILLLVISMMFYTGTQHLSIFNKDGLIAGLVMILRMFVLLIGFASISNELRNPLVKSILYRRGLGNLYHSLGLAFSILPEMIERNTNPKVFFKNPTKIITGMVNIADSVYNNFMHGIETREVIIVSGDRGEGKSKFLSKLAEELKNNKIEISGFIAEGLYIDNEKKGFILRNLENNEQKVLSSFEPIGNVKIGRFYFDEKVIEYGFDILDNANNDDFKIIIVDEIGQLELKNKGWSKAVEKIMPNTNVIQVWAVRKKYINDVLRRFAISRATVFDISEDSISDFSKFIKTQKKRTV